MTFVTEMPPTGHNRSKCMGWYSQPRKRNGTVSSEKGEIEKVHGPAEDKKRMRPVRSNLLEDMTLMPSQRREPLGGCAQYSIASLLYI